MYINYRPVSVIIPTWNRANTIAKAIKSVLNQTVPVLEIVVYDDGSTDNTFEIVQAIKDRRVRWFSGRHFGLPAVIRNRAIEKSKGEWIAFLDSDDEWYPKKLEKQLELVKKTNCLAVCCNAYSVNNMGDKKKYLDYSKNTITFSDLLKVNYIILSSAIIHRSLINKHIRFPEIPELKTGPDYAFWLRISTQTKFYYLNKILVNYFDDSSTTIRRFTKNPFIQKKIILKDFLAWSRTENIPLFYQANAIKHYISVSTTLFKNQLIENIKKMEKFS